MTLRRVTLTSAAALALTLAAGGPALATGPGASHPAAPQGSGAAAQRGPVQFALPTGFQPEGIDVGPGEVAYLGSLANGSILRADLRTGRSEVFSPAVGRPAVGVEVDDRGRLFVSGGGSGTARVIDTVTGTVLASYQLAAVGAPSFVNDVVVTETAAWFTDSVNQVLYRLPIGRFGQLPAQADVATVPLTGDLVYDADPATFEANGIETTPDGSGLLVVQSGTGLLFRVDPATGRTTTVDLGGERLVNGDGLTRDGNTLYAVQNRSNRLAVVQLDHDGLRGHVRQRVGDPRFDVPTTVALSGDRLYLPNARFGTPSPATAAYSVVALPRP